MADVSDLSQLNEEAASILLTMLPAAQPRILLAEADWPLKPRPHLGRWQRRGEKTDYAALGGHYDGALLGLPRARDELIMNLHLTAARLKPDAPLALFGLKDAGISAAEKQLLNLFARVALARTKYHGRVFIARQPHNAVRGDLADWAQEQAVRLDDAAISLVSYPGLFAAGQLDPATALLIAQLPLLPAPKLLLDYACGTGLLALAARRLWPQARLHLLDHDALALHAAQANVPGAEYFQAESLTVCPARYDLILSNPPIHRGDKQDFGIVEQLIAQAPDYLARGGVLVMVTQQTVPVLRFAKQAQQLAQAQGFRVWSIRG